MRDIRPAKYNNHHTHFKPFISPDLGTATHVFIRDDTVRASLKQPYDGPFQVKQRFDKYFIVARNGRETKISIDRLKPAFIDIEDQPTTQKPQYMRQGQRFNTPAGERYPNETQTPHSHPNSQPSTSLQPANVSSRHVTFRTPIQSTQPSPPPVQRRGPGRPSGSRTLIPRRIDNTPSPTATVRTTRVRRPPQRYSPSQ